MKLANAMFAALAALTLTLGAAGSARAQLDPEPAQYMGHARMDLRGSTSNWVVGPATQLAGDVYNNTNPLATPIFGFSSTDFASIFGDRVTTTGTGILAENDFTVYNGAGGNLLTASFNIGLYDASTSTFLGGYTTGVVNFGTGIPAGQFTVITVTGLSALNLNVNTTDVLIVQQIATHTGTSAAAGIASLDPPTIGSSANTMYISSSTVNGGVAGYYNIGSPPRNANPGYRINVTQPTAAANKTWGGVKAMYH